MKCVNASKAILGGVCAGVINGLLGTGGGMVLVPILSSCPQFQKKEAFSASVAVMLSLSFVTLLLSGNTAVFSHAVLYWFLIGSTVGGVLASAHPLPLKWMHRILGGFILAGGIRYLC